MAWRYTFDGGEEKSFDCASSLYVLAAMAAFAAETVDRLPEVSGGIHLYDGHVVVLWNDSVAPEYGPYKFGIGLNQYGSITIPSLTDT
jgi:hypothetical protein